MLRSKGHGKGINVHHVIGSLGMLRWMLLPVQDRDRCISEPISGPISGLADFHTDSDFQGGIAANAEKR